MKNISRLIPIVAATAFLLIAFSGPVSAGRGVDAGQQGWRPWCAGNLSDEDQEVLSKERQAFFDDTQDLRQDMYQKRLELQSELAKKNPDAPKAVALQNDISKLTEEFDQKRLDFILKMRKTNPDMGRIGSWRGKNEGVADCPNYGHHMGRWKGYGMMGRGYGMGPGMRGPGYGMGPGMMGDDDGDWNCPYDGRSLGPGRGYGMMGRGYGMGPGYGRAQGSMGRASEQGETGPTSGRLETPLKEDGARTTVENYLQSTRNPNLKLGKITEQGDAFEAEIVTKDGSLVDKLLIDKSTGWMHPANQ